MRYKCYRRYFMQFFVNSVKRLNSPVYSAPPYTNNAERNIMLFLVCLCVSVREKKTENQLIRN